jgi:tRNA wybutosine-synthesizing protein 4
MPSYIRFAIVLESPTAKKKKMSASSSSSSLIFTRKSRRAKRDERSDDAQDNDSDSDRPVKETNSSALLGKLSAAQLGYFRDANLQCFVDASSSSQQQRRGDPLMNRGYFSRVAAVRQLASHFVSRHESGRLQVVVLGAGSCTLFFHMCQNALIDRRRGHRWLDIDFADTIQRKLKSVYAHERLHRCCCCAERACADGGHDESFYGAVGCDLRDLKRLDSVLGERLDCDAPTLFLAECVLVYLDGERGTDIVRLIASRFKCASFVGYDPIEPNDAFGRVMTANLERRGCTLRSVHAFPSLDAQRKRFLSNGWTLARALTMYDIYQRHIDTEQRRRIERIEMLDEFEEWTMLQKHYCIVWASLSATSSTDLDWSFQQDSQTEEDSNSGSQPKTK